MSKKSVFTTITPLPATISRETANDALHDHKLMIDLNPLVIERKLVPKAPHFASAEEYNCKWYLITDRISYMPGRMVTGKVDYYACFHDLPNGLQTHCFAPMGLDIRSRWSIGGSLPGEPREASELGLGLPKEGLYLREDVTMKCNIMLVSFVKKTFKRSHERLVERLGERTHVTEVGKHNERIYGGSGSGSMSPGTAASSMYASSPPPSGKASLSPYGSQFGGGGGGGSGDGPGQQPQPFYGSPAMAAQMAAQGVDLNNPYGPPLYQQMDPAFRAAAMQQQQQHSQAPQPGQPGYEHYQMWLQMQRQAQQQQPAGSMDSKTLGFQSGQQPVEIASSDVVNPGSGPHKAPAELQG